MSAYDTMILGDTPKVFLPLDGRIHNQSALPHIVSQVKPAAAAPLQTTDMPNGDAAFVFPGILGQYIEIADSNYLSSYSGRLSVEFWVRPDVYSYAHSEPVTSNGQRIDSGYVYIMGKGDVPNAFEYAFRHYSIDTPTESPARPNRMSCYAWDTTGGLGTGSFWQPVIGTTDFLPRKWHHVVGIIEARTGAQAVDPTNYPMGWVEMWVDGTQRDKTSMTQFNTTVTPGPAPFRIGTRNGTSAFQGAIGKVAIYSRALSPADITEHYTAMIA